MDPTDIEKKSLEAHVELCAQRYQFLETKLDILEATLASQAKMISEVHDMVQTMSAKRNDQLIAWGLGIIGTMGAAIAWLTVQYLNKL
jgi:3-dehydroquinate synthetase